MSDPAGTIDAKREAAALPVDVYAELLHASQAVMRGRLSFADFCHRVAERAGDLMAADGAAVLAVDPTRCYLTPRAGVGNLAILMQRWVASSPDPFDNPPAPPTTVQPLLLTSTALREAVRSDRAVRLREGAGRDASCTDHHDALPAVGPTDGDRAYFDAALATGGELLAMPLWCHGRVGGLLVVSRDSEQPGGAVDAEPVNGTSVGFETAHPAQLVALTDLAAVTLANGRLREEVETGQRRFEALADHSSDMISVHDPQGRYQYVSPAVKRFLHADPEQVIGRSGYDFIHPEDIPAVAASHERVVRGEEPNRVIFRLCPVDGDAPRWAETSLRVVRDPATGDLGRLVCITRDVTEQVGAREELRRSRRQLENIVNDQVEMIVRTDAAGTITFCNQAFARLVGETPDALAGRDIYQLAPPDQREMIRRRFKAATPDSPLWLNEHPMTDPTGRRLWVRWTNRALFDETGRLIGKQGVGVDITDRREAEQALKQSEQRQRVIADRLQILLHELDHRVKNNLAELHSLVMLYQDSKGTVGEFVEAIGGKIQAMKTVHELIAAGGWQPLDLSAIVRGLREHFQCVCGEMNLKVRGASVVVPPRQASALAMILHELLINSQKHGALCKPGGEVTLDWHEQTADTAEGEEGCRLELTWRERGVASAAPDESAGGQGLSLIRGLAEFNLGGSARFDFSENGFEAMVRCMLQDEVPMFPDAEGEAMTDE